MNAVTTFIGLGSNLAQPAQQIKQACQQLQALPQTRLNKMSSLYRSKPLGPQDQPDFVNAVCALQTNLSALALLDALQAIEAQQGRVKKRHWGERLIDLDILLYGHESIYNSRLCIPHKEMIHRDFVLLPLAEIAPGLLIPGHGKVEWLISQLNTAFITKQ